MESNKHIISIAENLTSTPKRRRLGIFKSRTTHHDVFHKIMSPVQPQKHRTVPSERCESPLPCNQIEYLYSSNNTSNDEIPESPGIMESTDVLTSRQFEKTFFTNTFLSQKLKNNRRISDDKENKEIMDDFFQSELEIPQSSIVENPENINITIGASYREMVEESFNIVHQSIAALEEKSMNNLDNLFETKDSLFLDIKDALPQEPKKNCEIFKNYAPNTFYGLPLLAKSLFKSMRNIEKLYDWQEECLDLDAVKCRRNLIYALPTCGGKTLVAEILMMREVLVRQKHALFILPFVAIAQEKIYSLSPFAVQLNFLVEEYAAGKGHIPPKKRRTKRSVYIATIEKGLALIRSLIELDRLDEIGLIVVDELHLIGEAGRGATLETLLATVMCANKNIQIVGMSATIGNLSEVASFLKADVFERHFRPLELDEYVKLGNVLYRIRWKGGEVELEMERELKYDYTPAAVALDPDYLGGLVAEVCPQHSCLIFCPTKRNCENVANLLCKMQRKEMLEHRVTERVTLSQTLRGVGARASLCETVTRGVAYHHAGLAADERAEIEAAFRSGVVSVICCTSTLAAGVNLPAARVVVRAPHAAPAFTLAHYKQMAGRAGRTATADIGESILISSERDWPALRSTLSGGMSPALSSLHCCVADFVLSAVSLKLADTRAKLKGLLKTTLMAVQEEHLQINISTLCDEAIRSLITLDALDTRHSGTVTDTSQLVVVEDKCYVRSDSVLRVSDFGNAAIKGCMDLASARQLYKDLKVASKGLVLKGSCHLLYLLTPNDAMGLRIDYRHYYSLYCNLNEECLQTATALGITEKVAIRMMTGKPITSVPESVLRRFYLALALNDLWNQMPFADVANKYILERGSIQSLMSSAASSASSAARFCAQLKPLWPFHAIFAELAPRVMYCAAPEIMELMELPAVKKVRALQLVKAGYNRIEDIAKANPVALTAAVTNLSRNAASQLVSSARMMLIEKVENLRAEAEEVMEGLEF